MKDCEGQTHNLINFIKISWWEKSRESSDIHATNYKSLKPLIKCGFILTDDYSHCHASISMFHVHLEKLRTCILWTCIYSIQNIKVLTNALSCFPPGFAPYCNTLKTFSFGSLLGAVRRRGALMAARARRPRPFASQEAANKHKIRRAFAKYFIVIAALVCFSFSAN